MFALNANLIGNMMTTILLTIFAFAMLFSAVEAGRKTCYLFLLHLIFLECQNPCPAGKTCKESLVYALKGQYFCSKLLKNIYYQFLTIPFPKKLYYRKVKGNRRSWNQC